MPIWIEALKEFNEGKGMWCIPKRGSAELDVVRKIVERMKSPKTESPKPEKEEPEMEPKKRKLRNPIQNPETKSGLSKESEDYHKYALKLIDLKNERIHRVHFTRSGPVIFLTDDEYKKMNSLYSQASKAKGDERVKLGKELTSLKLKLRKIRKDEEKELNRLKNLYENSKT